MKTDARLKKIPEPKRIELLKVHSAAICPECDAWVTLRSKKKDGTHSGIEYAVHYEQRHSQLTMKLG